MFKKSTFIVFGLPKKTKVHVLIMIVNDVHSAKYNANVCFVALKVIFVQIKFYTEIHLVRFCEKSGFHFTKEDAQDTDMTFHFYIKLD